MSTVCPKCKTAAQKRDDHYECPSCRYRFCGQETEVFSRVVGYYRPVKNWNKGKKQEFKDRKPYRSLAPPVGV